MVRTCHCKINKILNTPNKGLTIPGLWHRNTYPYYKSGSIYLPSSSVIRHFSQKVRLYSDNNSNYSLPDLVKSRNVWGEQDASTNPDTNSNSVVDDVNKDISNVMRNIHDRAGIEYTVVESTNEKIPDWSPKQIEELTSEFENHKSKEEAQELFDKVYTDITRAYANTNEITSKDRRDEISVGRILFEDALEMKKVEMGSEEFLKLSEKREQEVKEINDYYDDRNKDNVRHYDQAKEQLLLAAQSSNFSIETRGHNEEYYEIQDQLRSDDTPSPVNNQSPFKQDSSDVMQDDFPPFEPGDD